MKISFFISTWRSRLYIRTAFLVFFLTLLSLSLIGYLLFYDVRKNLENQFNTNLVNISNFIENEIDFSQLQLIQLTGAKSRSYRRFLQKLNIIIKNYQLRRIFIFDSKKKSIIDTYSKEYTDNIYYDLYLDKAELNDLQKNTIVTSKLYQDKNGILFKRVYKKIHLFNSDYFIGIEANNDFLIAWKKSRNLFLSLAGGILVFSFISAYFFTRSITIPIRRLVGTTRAIQKGDLTQAIRISLKDEIGVLADNMEKMRRSILRKEEQKQIVLAGINHEIRNPIAGIEMFAGIIAKETGEQKIREQAKKIMKECHQIQKILKEFHEFGRPVTPAVQTCDLIAHVEEIEQLLAPELEKKKITMDVEARNGKVEVRFDPGHLQQILSNLIRNAIQFSPPGEKITIYIHPGDPPTLDIRDHGPGISAEIGERVFEPFYSSQPGHTGLGLAIVKNLMEENRGAIQLLPSENGAWFRLTFMS